MAKFKLDTERIKQYLIDKGEMVGLIAAGAVMGLFVVLGVFMFIFSRSRDKEIAEAAKSLDTKVRNDRSTEKPDASKITSPVWDPLDYFFFEPKFAWDPLFEGADTRRRNPPILPVGKLEGDQIKELQADAVLAPVRQYRLEFADSLEKSKVEIFTKGGPAAAGATAQPTVGTAPAATTPANGAVQVIKGRRMVAVTTVFPYRQQLELFRRALRKDTVQELFKEKDTTPVIVGLYVKRRVYPGDMAKWEPVYAVDDEGRPVALGETGKLLREAVYDDSDFARLKDKMVTGLATPLPLLAAGKYPKLNFPDFLPSQPDKTAVAMGETPVPGKGVVPPAGGGGKNPLEQMSGGGGGPGGVGGKGIPGGGGGIPGTGGKGIPGTGGQPGAGGKGAPDKEHPESAPEFKELKELDKAMQKQFRRRFRPRFNPFQPFDAPLPNSANLLAAVKGTDAAPADVDPDDLEDNEKKTAPDKGKAAKFEAPEKVLVRFIDADVQPGKLYQYLIKVVMRNPNFERKDVIYKGMADLKVLESPEVWTPWVAVEPEWQFYVVDENILRPPVGGKLPPYSTRLTPNVQSGRSQTAVQIHQWVPDFQDVDKENRQLGDWVILERLLVRPGQRIQPERPVGVTLPEWVADRLVFQSSDRKTKSGARARVKWDFVSPTAPLVVDFHGGKLDYPVPGRGAPQSDVGPLQMLLLTPDGKLITRNSRQDADLSDPRGKARWEHLVEWVGREDGVFHMHAPAAPPPPKTNTK
jgi:hypothetical protein